MIPDYWEIRGQSDRGYYRVHNLAGRVALSVPDDSRAVQKHQVQGYDREVYNAAQRWQLFGLSSVPLTGSKGVALYQYGDRGQATIVADEDPRYRPTGQQPGELTLYMVDGAGSDGSGGTLRRILTAALGWAATLLGRTITIGDGNTQTVEIFAPIVTVHGELRVTGAVTAGYGGGDQIGVQTHRHGGVESGAGTTAAPTAGS